MMLKPIQLPVFWCQEHQAMLCGQDSLNKHNEMCHQGHQDDESKQDSSEGQAGTCSGKAEGKKPDGNESVSRVVNDGLPVRSEQSNDTLDGERGIRAGLTATLEAGPSCGQVFARREDGPLNEKARTSQSFVMGRSTQGVIPNRLEIANKGGANNSSQTDPPQVKAKTVEGVLPGVTANPTDLVEINHYDCELCDKTFGQLQLLRFHLLNEHKVGPTQVSAIVKKFEADNDEDKDTGVGAANGDHHLDDVAGERIQRIGRKPSTDDSNEVDRKSRSRCPSVEYAGCYPPGPARADGINQGSTSQIDSTLDKTRLQKFSNETGSPNEEAMDVGAVNVEVHVVNDQGRSSVERISNRIQPPSDAAASFKCIYNCNKEFSRNCDRTVHIRRRHQDQTIVKCTRCKFHTAEILMEEHISRSHGITQDQRTVASTSRALLNPAGDGGVLSGTSATSRITRNRTAIAGGKPLMSGVRASYPPKRVSMTGRASTGSTKTRMSTRSDTKKKYPCDQCVKIFRRPVYLEDHKAYIHEGKSPYNCPFCDHQDACRYRMKGHIKKVHRIDGVLPTPTRAANVNL